MYVSCKDLQLHLRQLTLDDAKKLAEISNDSHIGRNMGNEFPMPYTLNDALKFIEVANIKFNEGNGAYFGICMNGSDELIGACGIDIDLKNKSGELTYWLGRKYQGRGMASQALLLLIDYCFEYLKLNRLYARVLSFNSDSINLLQKLGFANEGILRESRFDPDTGGFNDEFVFSLLKSGHNKGINIELH